MKNFCIYMGWMLLLPLLSIRPVLADDLSPTFPQGESVLEEGSSIFKSKCALCHGLKGQGMVGPNLTDDYWMHGNGSLESIFETVVNGIPEKGMIPWHTQLSDSEMRAVTVFIHSLKGSNPRKPKAPEGKLIETTE